MNYQQEIALLVAERGYRDGWTDEQFAARQVAKLVEEVGELVDWTYMIRYEEWMEHLQRAERLAARCFNDQTKGRWIHSTVNPERAAEELADILVVVYNLADALGIDINELALEKAHADVERGTR